MDSLTLVILGVTGNLAQKYTLQALYDMAEKNLLPPKMNIIGVARREFSRQEFAGYIDEVLHKENIHHKHEIKREVFKKLVKKMHYLSGNLDDPAFYKRLQELMGKLAKGKRNSVIYYLATYPELYHYVFENLQRLGLNQQKNGWVRVMVEKPIGQDLKSAQQLNHLLTNYFTEDQIFRLDHYLGKETLQNILSFRFANDIFEPLINKDFIDHIQITALEDFGVGNRGGYYDLMGALRDVGQNHLLQMLAFVTMDAPLEFTNEAITAQRLKILQKLIPLSDKIVFGQYAGYLKELKVAQNSRTDTFYALKTYINTDRFKDVPIYIRAGKKLKQTVTEISIVFKNPTNRLFKNLDCGDEPNVLVYRIQPNEGIVLKILTKIPGHETKLQPEYMQYCYKTDPYMHLLPDPYERLFMDIIRGDQTFFNDAKEVEAQWAFIDPLIAVRDEPYIYKPGSWGPKEVDELIEKDGRSWLEPSMDFCNIGT